MALYLKSRIQYSPVLQTGLVDQVAAVDYLQTLVTKINISDMFMSNIHYQSFGWSPPPPSSALLLDVLLLFSILFVEFIFHISYPIHARSRGFL